MSTLTAFLLGSIIFLALGVILGAFIVYKFNPKDVSYAIEKLKAKKGGVIDVKQESEKKRKLFKFKDRRQRK